MYGSTRQGLTVGEFASAVGAEPRRIEWWVERGFLKVDGIGQGPGKWRRIPAEEVPIAKRVMEYTAKLGVRASDQLFAVVREEAA